MSKKKKDKKIDYSDVNTVDPPIIPMKADGGYKINRVVYEFAIDTELVASPWMDWQEATRRHMEAKEKGDMVEIDPEYLNKDGTANLRKKRFPKEVQEEYQ